MYKHMVLTEYTKRNEQEYPDINVGINKQTGLNVWKVLGVVLVVPYVLAPPVQSEMWS